MIDRKIFCFWTGDDVFSENRKNSLECLNSTSGCEIILVTKDNITDYVFSEFPLHTQYKNLSSTHKSDYLRSYFMYHYGGGYADIKSYNFNWNPYFDILEKSEKQFIGSQEQNYHDIAGEDFVKSQWQSLVSNGFYIFKPKTKFAEEWCKRTNFVLDFYAEKLEKYPGTYHPRAVKEGIHDANIGEMSEPKGYPLEWNELLGRIFHKLQSERVGDYMTGMPPFLLALNNLSYR